MDSTSTFSVGCGDSWGAYIEESIGFGQGGLFDAIAQISGLRIKNVATAGDSSEQTAGLKRVSKIRAVLPGAKFLFISSGGDDICGDQFRIWLNKNTGQGVSGAINRMRFNAALDLIISDYEDLVELRDEIAPDCIIVTHSYDFPVASMMGRGILWLGPWMSPGFIDRGWTNPADMATIVKNLLAGLDERLGIFASEYPNIIHCRTQGTLSALAGDDGARYWANEMHLNWQGFLELAKVINAKAILPSLNAQSAIGNAQPTFGRQSAILPCS